MGINPHEISSCHHPQTLEQCGKHCVHFPVDYDTPQYMKGSITPKLIINQPTMLLYPQHEI